MDTNRVTLIATKAIKYGGVRIASGNAFSATPKDARVLKAIKHAVDAPAPAPTPAPLPIAVPARHYETAALHADPETSEKIDPSESTEESEPTRRRGYRRRDLTAKP